MDTQSQSQDSKPLDPVIPSALCSLGSMVTTVESITKLKDMAITIVNAFNQNLQDIQNGDHIFSNPDNSHIIHFAIGDSISILPAMNHLGLILTRILKVENKIISENKKNKDIEWKESEKQPLSECKIDTIDQYINNLLCNKNKVEKNDETNNCY